MTGIGWLILSLLTVGLVAVVVGAALMDRSDVAAPALVLTGRAVVVLGFVIALARAVTA